MFNECTGGRQIDRVLSPRVFHGKTPGGGRKQVKDLPVTVTLDDSQAMMPAMKLSNFDQVVVGARISKSGNAMPQNGDLQGSVSPVDTATKETVEITINSTVQ
jgi:cytochrome c-type biogenesis protein CcmH